MLRSAAGFAALLALRTLAAPPLAAQDTVRVVVVATTDVHGRVYHWDHVRDGEAPWGLTRAATVIDSLRRAYPGSVVVLDAGDLIEGEPFATYFATERPAEPNGVIEALNWVGYDALTPGNHEFNFGWGVLQHALATARFPVVSGNIYELPADTLRLPEYVVLERHGARIGVTGFTTPGTMVWDRSNVAGRVRVRPILPEAERVLARMDSAGLDLRIVLAHTGLDGAASYDTAGVGPENVAAELAALPTRPHLVVVGHTHRTVADSVIAGVHFIQPARWAFGVSVAHLWLVRDPHPASGARYRVARVVAEHVTLGRVSPDTALARRLEPLHRDVRRWVGMPLARTEGDWSARDARAQDTPIIDFVNEVQRRRASTELSSTAAFTTRGGLGPGEVRLRDVAGVYPYENTLKAVRIDGRSLRAYLERSTAYFRTYRPGEPIINDSVPGYNFDIVSGVEYVIDLSHPIGERIRDLTRNGRPVLPTDTFTLALNNYRQGGGGGFAMLAGLPLLYDSEESIRDLLVAYLREARTLDAAEYFRPSWRIEPPEAAEVVRTTLRTRAGGGP